MTLYPRMEADKRGTGRRGPPEHLVRNLASAAAELLERAAAASAGRAALTLVLGAGAPLKQTLLALRGGVHLAEHDAPGVATLQVLQGRLRLVTSQDSWEFGQGDHLQIPPSRHRLESLEDAASC